MAKLNAFTRYRIIIRKIEHNDGVTLDELVEYVKDELELRGIDKIGTSTKTIRRDIKDITTDFGIPIKYSKTRGYHIAEDEAAGENPLLDLFDTIDLLHVMKRNSGLKDFVFTEEHPFRGSEHLSTLLHAIQSHRVVCFHYQKHGEDQATKRQVYPYALKEVRNRWYLLCMEAADEKGIIKSFGLDRISGISILPETFTPMPVGIKDIYRDCFGIYSLYGIEPEEIVLSFNEVEGKLTESQPLHRTQESFTDVTRPDRRFIRLRLKISIDFINELLARGSSLEVHQPERLRKIIYERHREGMERNKVVRQ